MTTLVSFTSVLLENPLIIIITHRHYIWIVDLPIEKPETHILLNHMSSLGEKKITVIYIDVMGHVITLHLFQYFISSYFSHSYLVVHLLDQIISYI